MARGIARQRLRAGKFLFKLVDAILQVVIEREIDPRSPRADFAPAEVKRCAKHQRNAPLATMISPLTQAARLLMDRLSQVALEKCQQVGLGHGPHFLGDERSLLE